MISYVFVILTSYKEFEFITNVCVCVYFLTWQGPKGIWGINENMGGILGIKEICRGILGMYNR